MFELAVHIIIFLMACYNIVITSEACRWRARALIAEHNYQLALKQRNSQWRGKQSSGEEEGK
jgi:hypothetical protein